MVNKSSSCFTLKMNGSIPLVFQFVPTFVVGICASSFSLLDSLVREINSFIAFCRSVSASAYSSSASSSICRVCSFRLSQRLTHACGGQLGRLGRPSNRKMDSVKSSRVFLTFLPLLLLLGDRERGDEPGGPCPLATPPT